MVKSYDIVILPKRELRQSFGVRVMRSKVWENMQSDVVKSCSALRTGAIPWTHKNPPGIKEKEFRRRYGSSYLYPLSYPHFTMGEVSKAGDEEIILQRM